MNRKKVLILLLFQISVIPIFSQTAKHNLLDSFSSSFWKTLETPAGHRFAIGNSAHLFQQVSGCNSWVPVVLPNSITQSLRDISFPSAAVGYVSGTSGLLMKTADSGTTWITLNTGTTATLVSTYFVNDTTGFISGGGSSGKIIYKTTDGGVSWNDVTPTGLTSTPYELLFTNIDTGYALCTNGEILKSIDAGNTWVTINAASSGIPSLYAGCQVNDSTIYGCGASGAIVKTSNYGQTWDTLNSGTTSFLWGIRFASDSVGVAMGSSGSLFLTLDAGITWEQQTIPFSTTIRDISWTNDHAGIIVGSSGLIFEFDYLSDQHILFEEHFCAPIDSVSSYGWTNTGVANTAEQFRFDNPTVNGVSYVMNDPFAIFDGSYYQNTLGFFNPDSSFIESPEFDASNFDTLSLSWHEAYLCNYLGEVYTRIEAFNGTSWVEVYHSNGVEINGSFSAVYTQPNVSSLAPRTVDITELAGVSNAKLRFTYYSTNNTTIKFWWAIDDILVSNKTADVALESVNLYPGMDGACVMTATEEVQVKISNVGNVAMYPLEYSYQINNNPVVDNSYYDKLEIGQDTVLTIATEDFSTPGIYTVKVWLRKVNDIQTQNDTVTAIFNSTGPLNLSLGNDTSICASSPFQIQSNVLGYDHIVWGNLETSAGISVDTSGVYTVQVTKEGCTEYDTLNVSLNGNPVLPTISVGDSLTLCVNEELVITSSSDSTLWSNSMVNDSLIFHGSGTIWAVGVDNGCYTTDTVFAVISPLALPAIPTISSSTTNFEFCEGTSLLLNASSSVPVTQYLWSDGSTLSQLSMIVSGDVSVSVFDGQCWSMNSDTVTVVSLATPDKPVIDVMGFDLSTATVADNYQWFFNGNDITGATLNQHNATQDGDYHVEVGFTNGCFNTSDVISLIGTNVSDLASKNLKIYPIPVENQLHIDSEFDISEVQLIDLSGKLLQKWEPNQKRFTQSLNVTPGVYVLKITTHAGIVLERVIVK